MSMWFGKKTLQKLTHLLTLGEAGYDKDEDNAEDCEANHLLLINRLRIKIAIVIRTMVPPGERFR